MLLEIQLEHKSFSAFIMDIGATMILIPLIMGKPSTGLTKLSLDQNESVLDMITFIVEGFCAEIILGGSVQKLDRFGIVK